MKTIHLCLDIAGFLNQMRRNPELAAGMFEIDGVPTTGPQSIAILEQNLAIGRKVLPFAKCEGFDYRTGCPGHEQQEGGENV
jgi:hypothetical protein